MSPRKRIADQSIAGQPVLAPRRDIRPAVRLATRIAAAVTVLVAAVVVSATVLVVHEQRRHVEVADAAVISSVRGFMVDFVSVDPFHANAYVERMQKQTAGEVGAYFRDQANGVLVSVARNEPTVGTVRAAGLERWNDDGTVDLVVVMHMVTTLPDGKKIEDGDRWRVTATHEGGLWKISQLQKVF